MARNRRARKAGRGSKGPRLGKSQITRVAFHSFTNSTMSGVTGNLALGLSPRSTVISPNTVAMTTEYDLYRYERLEYRLHPVDPTNANTVTMSYYPDVDTQTLTIAQNGGSPVATCLSHFSGVPSSWVKVPASSLKGMLDWYKCNADAGAAEFESQGTVVIASGASDVVYHEFRGVLAFKNPVSASLQLSRMRELLRPEIEEALLNKLRVSAPTTAENKVLGKVEATPR